MSRLVDRWKSLAASRAVRRVTDVSLLLGVLCHLSGRRFLFDRLTLLMKVAVIEFLSLANFEVFNTALN